ncbi:acid-soluble spore protein N [Bacillus andreraoultii]
MSKNDHQQYQPDHLGMQPRKYGGNKGKKMQDQSGQHPQVIQTKGE